MIQSQCHFLAERQDVASLKPLMTLAALNSPVDLNRSQLLIVGQQRLEGELHVNGAKNSALALMAASVLSREPIRLQNMPDLTDIGTMAKILVSLGAGFGMT